VAKVSIIVPSRQERFLPQTVADLLAKAAGEIEIIVVLDGYWPSPPLPDDPRVILLHHGHALGMRPAINHAAAIATGDYLLKCDAHTMWDECFDEKLKADYLEDNWILIPRRYALDPEKWAIDESNKKYPIDYHFLSCPINTPGDSTDGLHGSPWTARRDARKEFQIDDEMSSQGSGWFMSRRMWDRIGPLDWQHYGSFTQEFQELGLRAWLGGGAVKVTKNTWYAHLRKSGKWGRGYSMDGCNHVAGTAYCSWFWVNDEPFHGRVHSLKWLIEKFSPVPSWPEDIDAVLAEARRVFRNPYAVAA